MRTIIQVLLTGSVSLGVIVGILITPELTGIIGNCACCLFVYCFDPVLLVKGTGKGKKRSEYSRALKTK